MSIYLTRSLCRHTDSVLVIDLPGAKSQVASGSIIEYVSDGPITKDIDVSPHDSLGK